MGASASCRPLTFAGLRATQLELPCGDTLVVADHGAQVLSWVVGGRERLYLSQSSVMDGQAAIRGGVPVCFPQFNQRGPAPGLPKHGFARHLSWSVAPLPQQADRLGLSLTLQDTEHTRQNWDQAFLARLDLTLSPACLDLTLSVQNTGKQAWAFTGALHTYLAVDDIAQVRLAGLGGCPEWDSVTDRHGVGNASLGIEGEFDRVYSAVPGACELQDGPHRVAIHQSASWANTVVWNPGVERCATLADMPADGWRRMLCLEAAQVFTPLALEPAASWQGWQRLQVR